MTQSPNTTPDHRGRAIVVSSLLAFALAAVAVGLITSIARPETSPPTEAFAQSQSTAVDSTTSTSTTLLQTGPAVSTSRRRVSAQVMVRAQITQPQ